MQGFTGEGAAGGGRVGLDGDALGVLEAGNWAGRRAAVISLS